MKALLVASAVLSQCLRLSAAVSLANITYSSSIDPITNLSGLIYYDAAVTNRPVLVAMHGYSGDATSFDASIFTNFVGNGWFVVVPDMRGRRSAAGNPDDCGREIMDIFDALAYVRSTRPVSQRYAVMMGVSGGGADALGAACKLTDAFWAYISYFGISDWGTDPVNGYYEWLYPSGDPKLALQRLHIGGDSTLGDPAHFPDNWRSRDATEGIGVNMYGGWVYAYENNADALVNATNTGRIKVAMDMAGRTNYTVRMSDTLYVHSYPAAPMDSQADWIADTNKSWTMPTSGAVRVLGWIQTKAWSIWLGGGTNQVADVTYDLSANRFSIAPVTASVDPVISHGGCTVRAHLTNTAVLYDPTTAGSVVSAAVGTMRMQ